MLWKGSKSYIYIIGPRKYPLKTLESFSLDIHSKILLSSHEPFFVVFDRFHFLRLKSFTNFVSFCTRYQLLFVLFVHRLEIFPLETIFFWISATKWSTLCTFASTHLLFNSKCVEANVHNLVAEIQKKIVSKGKISRRWTKRTNNNCYLVQKETKLVKLFNRRKWNQSKTTKEGPWDDNNIFAVNVKWEWLKCLKRVFPWSYYVYVTFGAFSEHYHKEFFFSDSFVVYSCSCHVLLTEAIRRIWQCVNWLKWGWLAYTTPTAHDICTFAILCVRVWQLCNLP